MNGHFVAIPKTGSGPGVLVLHSWWGLNPFFRRLCRRLASNGFVALAPDLFDGATAESIDDAQELRREAMAKRKEPAYRFLIRKIGELTTHEAVVGPGVGVLGFSMGGHWAFWLGQRPELPIAATVTFYACRNGDYSKTPSAFLCHFAEEDEWVSDACTRELLRGFRRDAVEVESFDYPGTSHWFLESDRRDAHHPSAARLAWGRTLTFLDRTLGLPGTA